MTPHGPDANTFVNASTAELKPQKFDKGLAFMFESAHIFNLTDFALDCEHRDRKYQECWAPLPKVFTPDDPSGKGAFDGLKK